MIVALLALGMILSGSVVGTSYAQVTDECGQIQVTSGAQDATQNATGSDGIDQNQTATVAGDLS
ncbi:hypothetical protein [Halomicrobium urmianum]|uniref:hypothetical protein n=1 Tax=Halomicrobium urmianum TaxID=1586233 RepID=UPI001CDA12ED|nr:hypothetical protein [Halomicrobium urmianum]